MHPFTPLEIEKEMTWETKSFWSLHNW
jgi:hypothetical protein